MPTKNILCTGYSNWDVVFKSNAIPDPDHSELIKSHHDSCGGSATNTALSLSSLGCDVSLLTSLGDDKHGEFVMEALNNSDINTEPVIQTDDIRTTLIYAVVTESADPRYFAKAEEFKEVSVDDVPTETWEKTAHVHITSFHEEYPENIATRADEDGKTISFNPSQGYSKRGPFNKVVEHADIIFLNDNDREAENFRNWHTLAEVVDNGTHVVMTHGSAGCSVYRPDGVDNFPGYSVETVEDTIGAGDSFAAGYIYSWLNDYETEDVLKIANAVAASSVRYTGCPDTVDKNWVEETIDPINL